MPRTYTAGVRQESTGLSYSLIHSPSPPLVRMIQKVRLWSSPADPSPDCSSRAPAVRQRVARLNCLPQARICPRSSTSFVLPNSLQHCCAVAVTGWHVVLAASRFWPTHCTQVSSQQQGGWRWSSKCPWQTNVRVTTPHWFTTYTHWLCEVTFLSR